MTPFSARHRLCRRSSPMRSSTRLPACG
jgi:hypothetical protein